MSVRGHIMRRSIRWRPGANALALLWLVAAALAAPAAAQDFRGAHRRQGHRQDRRRPSRRAPSPSSTPKPTFRRRHITNESGNYTAPFLTPGTYRSPSSSQGFKKIERKAIEVRVGDRLALDFKLEVGGVEETITVASSHAAARDAIGIGRPGDRREAHRADAALGRQPVRAGAPRHRRRLHRRPQVLAPLRQRRHVGGHRRWRAPAATSSRSTARPTWPTAAASRSRRRPAPWPSSRSRRPPSTPSRATPPAPPST